MSEWAAKRFWTTATAAQVPGGWAVQLDDRPLRTPARQALIVPTQALARAVAQEWDAQTDRVDPGTMPMTRMANSAIDRVARAHADVAGYVAGYARTDLLCYRADGPQGLVRRQAQAWDPLLDWAADRLGARLVPTAGIMPVDQPADSLARLERLVGAHDAFALTALHDLVSLSGSLVIGLAATDAGFDPDDLWSRSRIDETWQIEQWGADAEAETDAENRRGGFLAAHRFFHSAQ